MALPVSNNAEGASAVGAIATTANTGGTSGTAFGSILVAGTVTFSDQFKAAGSYSYKCTQESATAGQSKLGWTSAALGTIASGTTIYGRFYMALPAYPSVTSTVCTARLAGIGQAFAVRVSTAGMVSIQGESATLATGTAALPLNALVRVEFQALIHATAGYVLTNVYHTPHGTTPTYSLGDTTANKAVRGSVDAIDLGLVTSATANVMYLDAMDVNATGMPAPVGTDVPPDWYRMSGGLWVPAGQIKRQIGTGGAWA